MPFAVSGGVLLYWESIGSEDAAPALLLGGAGKQATDSPDAFCEALAARGFRVIRFDQRDTGLSTDFADAGTGAAALAAGETINMAYDASDLAADALAVLDAVGVERAHLFGRSLGSYVAQVLALAQPQRVASLTLAMAFSRALGGSTPPERLAQLDAEKFADAEAFALRQIATARAVGNPDYFDEARVRAEAERAFARGVHSGAVARHFMVGLAARDIRAELGAITVPTQVIHGRLDRVIPLALAEETAAAIPGAKLLTLDDMAHEGPPQLWQRWIDAFVANAARG